MGKSTEISWTDHTFNPWWGCQRVSPGCEHCYAETMATRWGHKIWGPAKTTQRRFFGEKHWAEPLRWNAEAQQAGERQRVFCASMADVFEANSSVVGARDALWDLIDNTPWLDWLILTKRPENIKPGVTMPDRYWPNVWLGASTEDQQRADERIPLLLRLRDRVPALFLSVEPQLGPITFRDWLEPVCPTHNAVPDIIRCAHAGWNKATRPRVRLDWLITGGESGPGHRPFDLNWARQTRDECQAAGVAWHFKQVGGMTHAAGGCELDGREWKEFPEPRHVVAHACLSPG